MIRRSINPKVLKQRLESLTGDDRLDVSAIKGISGGGGDLNAVDIDTLAELNALLTDATLIDTTDSRLSDARTPTAHTHTATEISDSAPVGRSVLTAASELAARTAIGVNQALITESDGTTITLDIDNGGNRWHTVQIDGNRTLALSNVAVGNRWVVDIQQDAVTGSRTVTWWSGIKWPGGTEPTLTTAVSKIDSFGFVCTASGVYQGYILGQDI